MPKKERIEKLFDGIAPSYDRLNHLLSLGIDRTWRRRAVRKVIDCTQPLRILDVACGTGDMTIDLARRLLKKTAGNRTDTTYQTACEATLEADRHIPDEGTLVSRIAKECGTWKKSRSQRRRKPVEGIDLSENMLQICREKVTRAGLDEAVSVRQGDGEHLPYPDGHFDRVTIAFGIRNFEHIDLGLSEMRRVLTPGGKAVILELSVPQNAFKAWLYKLYFVKILPRIGGAISGDRASYNYLPASVLNFPAPDRFMEMMRAAGFTDIRHKSFTLGICRMYVGLTKK